MIDPAALKNLVDAACRRISATLEAGPVAHGSPFARPDAVRVAFMTAVQAEFETEARLRPRPVAIDKLVDLAAIHAPLHHLAVRV